jgi:hypothetical protein
MPKEFEHLKTELLDWQKEMNIKIVKLKPNPRVLKENLP